MAISKPFMAIDLALSSPRAGRRAALHLRDALHIEHRLVVVLPEQIIEPKGWEEGQQREVGDASGSPKTHGIWLDAAVFNRKSVKIPINSDEIWLL